MSSNPSVTTEFDPLDSILAVYYNEMADADARMVRERDIMGFCPAEGTPAYQAWNARYDDMVERRRRRWDEIRDETKRQIRALR